jgi:hypothetical protein
MIAGISRLVEAFYFISQNERKVGKAGNEAHNRDPALLLYGKGKMPKNDKRSGFVSSGRAVDCACAN